MYCIVCIQKHIQNVSNHFHITVFSSIVHFLCMNTCRVTVIYFFCLAWSKFMEIHGRSCESVKQRQSGIIHRGTWQDQTWSLFSVSSSKQITWCFINRPINMWRQKKRVFSRFVIQYMQCTHTAASFGWFICWKETPYICGIQICCMSKPFYSSCLFFFVIEIEIQNLITYQIQ